MPLAGSREQSAAARLVRDCLDGASEGLKGPDYWVYCFARVSAVDQVHWAAAFMSEKPMYGVHACGGDPIPGAWYIHA